MPPQAPPPEAGPSPSSARGMVGAIRKDQLRAALFDEPIRERRLGRYRVVGTLGRGGMGTVLEAVDDALERRVALKVLHRDVSLRDQGRLLREARALAKLSHPNVVQVHEVAEQPRPFIAMELVRGRTLAQWQQGRPPWRTCVRVYLQAGHGLAAAHAQHLVHRDFKPSNCIIDDEGRVRVVDFGLARTLGPADRASDEHVRPLEDAARSRSHDSTLTDQGAMIGTLAYMALEQLQGKEVDARSDQFGFCVALYEALYGQRPFEGRTVAALEDAMMHERVLPAPRGSRVPVALRRVLLRGLAAAPERRWPAMDGLLAALEGLVRPRWRARLAMGTAMGGLCLAGLSVWHEVTTRQACVGVADQLVGVWDAARREQLHEALLGSPLPYARAAWEGVQPRLDAYAEAWLEAAHEVCEETRVRQEQPESVVALRSACLHERKVALREAVDVLEEADPATVERAVGLVVQLPRLERCSDVPALLAEIPPPNDPEVLARVQDLRDALTEARALRIAARYASSLAVVDSIARAAENLDYPPLLAEVAVARGWALYGEGRNEDAVAAFEEAYARAVAEGHDAVAVDAASLLTYLTGVIEAKPELGLRWALAAHAHASRPTVEPGAEATALSNEAGVHQRSGDFARARSSLAQALALQEQVLGPDDVRLAFTLNGLGVAHAALGELDQAARHHQRALTLRRENLGPHHPHVAMSLNNLGVVAHQQGRFEEALGYLRDALEIKETILGPEHPDLVSSLANIGSLLRLRDEEEEATVFLQRAIAITERIHGPDAIQLAVPLLQFGQVLGQTERRDEAQAAFERVVALIERAHGPEHPDLVPALVNLATSLQYLERYEEGIVHVQRAQQIADRSFPPTSPQRSDPLMARAQLELGRGDAAAAAALAEQVLTQREHNGELPFRLALARLLWSKALVAGGGAPAREQALRLATQAHDDLESEVDPDAQRARANVEAWLAELSRDPPR